MFSPPALLAGNYIKGALFQGLSPLNVIKCNLLSVAARCVSSPEVSLLP